MTTQSPFGSSGTGLDSVAIEVPSERQILLSQENDLCLSSGEGCFAEDDDYGSLAEIEETYGQGSFSFSFNGGEDSVTLTFDPNPPGGDSFLGFPQHISPLSGGTIKPDEALEWGCSASQSCGSRFQAAICERSEDTAICAWFRECDGNLLERTADVSVTSWVPLCLGPSGDVDFALWGLQETEVPKRTNGNDDFIYESGFFSFNVIPIVVPEPSVSFGFPFAAGVVALLARRRSRALLGRPRN